MYDRSTWPIAAALLQFSGTAPDGGSVQNAGPEVWAETLRQVAEAGFEMVDLTDSWLRLGDLETTRRGELSAVLVEEGLTVPSLSITRRSVADPITGEENLAYAHRTIDAAAAMGVKVLSIGLHRPLTPAQKASLWFWVQPGDGDRIDDPDARALALARVQDIGRHAAAEGLLVSLELYEDTFLGTADGAVDFVDAVGLDNVGLNPDVGNLVRLHRPVESWQDILRKTLPYANYWQVKNYYRVEDPATGLCLSMPAPLESGFIDYRQAVNDAIRAGFDGVICCEHYGGDGLAVSAANMRYLRTLLPRPVTANRSDIRPHQLNGTPR